VYPAEAAPTSTQLCVLSIRSTISIDIFGCSTATRDTIISDIIIFGCSAIGSTIGGDIIFGCSTLPGGTEHKTTTAFTGTSTRQLCSITATQQAETTLVAWFERPIVGDIV
jgi:hypothetical protein